MNSLALVRLVVNLVAVQPFPSDTPPALPIAVNELTRLSTRSDVIAVSRLADGSPAPADIEMPELINRRQTLEYLRVHYPESMKSTVTKSPTIAWVFVNEQGRIADAYLVLPSGHPPLDSLSLNVLSVAEFKPAKAGGKRVGLWLPFPARVPPHAELIATLEADGRDISEHPIETPYTQKPVLLNRHQVEAAIIRIISGVNPTLRAINEAFARAQNVGGVVRMHIFIDESGTVANAIIQKTSGNADLDNSAKMIARMMRFTPAKHGDTPVPVWIEVPINFKAQ